MALVIIMIVMTANINPYINKWKYSNSKFAFNDFYNSWMYFYINDFWICFPLKQAQFYIIQ